MGSRTAGTSKVLRDADSEGRRRRPRFLCLHGYRTSGEIMRAQVIGKWPGCITSRLHLFFPDAPFPSEGKSEAGGVNPPAYQWFQFTKGFGAASVNFDECLSYIEELMIKYGPFDGLMGFSQGAMLSAALPGLQAKGIALRRVPPVKYSIIINGGKFLPPFMAAAYDVKIKCPSLHFIGELDSIKEHSEDLLDAFVNPIVVRHPSGHTIPRLDEKNVETVLSYIEGIEKDLHVTGRL